MNTLEKILNEIKASSVYGETKDGYGASIVPIGAVERIISKHMKNEGWISVEERLPEDGQEVLCCDDKEIYFVEYQADCDAPFGYMDGIIAWQPQPEPYKPDRRKEEKKMEINNDNVKHPAHYTAGKIECIEAIKESMTKEEYRGYLKGQVMKYIWRYQNKGKPLEDLQKAQQYLEWLIEEVKQDNDIEVPNWFSEACERMGGRNGGETGGNDKRATGTVPKQHRRDKGTYI